MIYSLKEPKSPNYISLPSYGMFYKNLIKIKVDNVINLSRHEICEESKIGNGVRVLYHIVSREINVLNKKELDSLLLLIRASNMNDLFLPKDTQLPLNIFREIRKIDKDKYKYINPEGLFFGGCINNLYSNHKFIRTIERNENPIVKLLNKMFIYKSTFITSIEFILILNFLRDNDIIIPEIEDLYKNKLVYSKIRKRI